MIEKNLIERYSLLAVICLVLALIFWIFSAFLYFKLAEVPKTIKRAVVVPSLLILDLIMV
jgi:hypothetical protein